MSERSPRRRAAGSIPSNNYHIIAKGQHITLAINDVMCSELIDQEEVHFDLKGVLGLQLRSGEPMTVPFKDITLKKL